MMTPPRRAGSHWPASRPQAAPIPSPARAMVWARRRLRADLRAATAATKPKPIPEPECEPRPELQGPASGQMVVLAIIKAERIQHRRHRLHARQPAKSDLVVSANHHGSHQKYRRAVVPAHQSGCGFERPTPASFPARNGRSHTQLAEAAGQFGAAALAAEMGSPAPRTDRRRDRGSVAPRSRHPHRLRPVPVRLSVGVAASRLEAKRRGPSG